MADNIIENLHEDLRIVDVVSLAPVGPPLDANELPENPIQADIVVPNPPLPGVIINQAPVVINQVPINVLPGAIVAGAANNPPGAVVPAQVIPPPVVRRVPRRMPPRVPARHCMVLRNNRSVCYNFRVLPSDKF